MAKLSATAAWLGIGMLTVAAGAVRGQGQPVSDAEEAVTTIDESADLMIPQDRLQWHLPDPINEDEAVMDEPGQQQEGDTAYKKYVERVRRRVHTIQRPVQLRLSLEDAIRRALASSFTIEVQHYNPAIEMTRLVEAEAAFDAVFFANITKNKQDRPTGSQLVSSDLDFFSMNSGIRKLLPLGTQVRATYGLQRTKTSLAFQQLNPEYFSDLALEARQPLLRGFGLDYNRSLIKIAKNDRSISMHVFRRQVRDTLRQIEELYWRLAQARRDVVITARLLAEFERIYEYLEARQAFDVTPVQLSATKANLEQSRADFVRTQAAVFDAEDRLIAAMNDPEIDLADNIEIIPEDFPQLNRIVVDRLGEVQTALDNRPEIKEEELRVSNAKIALARAQIDELPRLDLTFRYTIDGIGPTADRSFDEFTRHKFVEYFVGVEFEVPIGNRARLAASQRARLQHAQAVSLLKGRIEEVILDVNLAVRALSTAFDQIAPSYESAEARKREVDSIVARAERKDINTLNLELNSRQSLANARRNMLNAMVEYNIAIADLERAKGTLLQYCNVTIAEDAP